MESYPRELSARVDYELTTYDHWYRSKTSRLERPFYYHHHPSNELAFVRSLLDKHAVPTGARLIDVGCGNGLYADMFVQQGLRVSAEDLSEVAIEYAKRTRQGMVDWIVGDALTLPLRNSGNMARTWAIV